MKLLIILCCLVVVQARSTKKLCQGISIDGIYYKKELLLRNFDRPYQMAVNKMKNDLYFSYSLNDNTSESMSVRLNMDAKKYYQIRSIERGFSHAVDQATGDVYIGAFNSIYKYKHGHKPTEIVTNLQNLVVDMYFWNNELFYVTYPDEKLNVYRDGKTETFPDFDETKIGFLRIQNYNELYFANDTGIYRMNATDTVLLGYVSRDDLTGMALDNNGQLFASLSDGLYMFHENSMSMMKVFDVPFAFGVTFDRDNNIIYSTANGIVRLLPIDESECEFIYK